MFYWLKTGPDWRGREEASSVDKIAEAGGCRASYWTPIPEDLWETDTLGRLLLVAFAMSAFAHLHVHRHTYCFTSRSQAAHLTS